MPAAPLHADPASIAQLLDEHHLVIQGAAERRLALGSSLGRHVTGLPETRVVEIDGTTVTTIEAFTAAVAAGLDRTARTAVLEGLVGLLRALPRCQRIYFLWHDADAMLESDPSAFARVVNAVLGIAAEREHLSRDEYILERWIFLGGPALGIYAADDRGQFHAWLDEDGATPFWDVAAVVERPNVMTVNLDT